MPSGIQLFMHCRGCRDRGKPDKVVVGLTDPFTLRAWCEKCDTLVADFKVAEPVRAWCEECGKPIGPDHAH